jgi:type IV secretory pathway VirD2 relaxase
MGVVGRDGGSGAGADTAATTMRDRLATRLIARPEAIQPRMPSRLKGDAGSVRASLARKLVGARMFGRSGGTNGDAGKSAGGKSGGGSISVRAAQRVVVKAFVARHGGMRGVANPAKAIAGHVRYLARDGVGHDGSDANFYGPEGAIERTAVNEATGTWAEDRHHFRLIISPEQADKMEDLEGYVSDVMRDVGADLKEPKLTWIAINHFDTDQPHAHVLIRGVRAKGTTLIVPRDIISHGIRHRAEHHAQTLLGDKTRGEAEQQLFARTKANYWTDIDAKLGKLAQVNEGVLPASELTRHDTFGAIARGRVIHLERMGLATRSTRGVTFAPDMKRRLDTLQRSRDEIRSHWDRERAKAFGDHTRGKPMAPQGANRDVEKSKAQLLRKPDAAGTLDHRFDPTTNRLTKADIVLANRSVQNGPGIRYDDDFEHDIAARAAHLIRSCQGRALGNGIAFDAQSWQKLRDNEINAAARDQMGLNRGAIQAQLSMSEGKVLGHIETSLGRHAVIDRGVNVAAVREVSGAELVAGQMLGIGISR